MSLFPLTYRLCNPIIELPPPGLRLAAAFRSRKRVQKYNRQTKQPNFSMTFFKLFYTTDTQNTRLTHRTTLENKNINARKKFTGKTRKKHTPAGRQRKTTRKKTQNAIFEKRDVLFKLTRLCFLHHVRQDGGTKY